MSARRRLHAVHVSKWRPRVTDLSFYILILAYILHYLGPSWTRLARWRSRGSGPGAPPFWRVGDIMARVRVGI